MTATAPPMPAPGGSLFEREAEVAALEALLDGGGGRLALIDGPAGIGKTRLLEEIRRRAGGRMRVLSARAGELERDFPFGVVRQLFEAAVADPERGERAFAGAAAPARAVFGALDAADDDADLSFAVLHGLFWLTLNLGEDEPLLLAVDDIQWCDRPSLRFLAYLTRRLEGTAILMAATRRSAEPGTDPALIADLAADPATMPLRPGRLTEGAVRELIEEALGAAPAGEFARACHATTGGNPLLVRQLLRALQSDGVRPDTASAGLVREIGPRAVSHTLLLRLARLPEDAAAVARAVAVLCQSSDLQTVAALTGLDEARVAAAAATLAQAEILRAEPPLGFIHPLVRDAVYRELPPGQRELEHARAANVLRDLGAGPDAVATQLLRTPAAGEEWVVEQLREAARMASRRSASESAATYLRRALAEPPPERDRPRVLLELGMAEALVSGPDAVEHLRAAYRALDDPRERTAVAGVLARILMFTGDAEGGATVARRAAEALPPEMEDERRQLLAFELLTIFFGAGDPARVAQLREYRRRGEGGIGLRMLQAMAAWEWMLDFGPIDECAELGLHALADGRLVAQDGNVMAVAAIAPAVLADRDEAIQHWDRVAARAHETGSQFVMVAMHVWRGYTLIRRGDLESAEREVRQAAEAATLWGYHGPMHAHAAAYISDVLRERGELEEARRVLDAVDRADVRGDTTGWWLLSEVALLVAERRAEEAVAVADELQAHCESFPTPARLGWRPLKAEALHLAGRDDEALALAREHLEQMRRSGAAAGVGGALRVLGTLEGDDGLAHLEEAVAVLEGTAARLEHARALAALGGALRRKRRPSDAREPLRRALELAAACGADGLAEQVRSELYAAGARPRTEALAGVESLTPSERRVVDLAVEGHTNKEIAQALYVTPKTVEVHLSSAYRKLGIRSRRELPRALS